MKKVIFVIVAFCFSMCLVAQTDSTQNKMNGDANNDHKITKIINHKIIYKLFSDGVMMKNEKIMIVKNGKLTVLDHEMFLDNGTIVMVNGTMMRKDGKEMMLKEGRTTNGYGWKYKEF